ncbi:MAG: hypothetical protein JRH19_10180, partial [Deltaproteobacteria bacterium]|nr:hypothetical protein [Deltaproteobacteria bacterium]
MKVEFPQEKAPDRASSQHGASGLGRRLAPARALWMGLGALLIVGSAGPPTARAQASGQSELEAAEATLRQQIEEAARLEAEARAMREASEEARRSAERVAKEEAKRAAQEAEERSTSRLESDIDEQLRVQNEMLSRAARNERAASRNEL